MSEPQAEPVVGDILPIPRTFGATVAVSIPDATTRASISATLAAAYADYLGFTEQDGRITAHFADVVPADLPTTLAPFTVSTQSRQLAGLFQALADNTALDATTRATCQQAASTLNPA